MKVICDLRSEFPILSNWDKEAWKKASVLKYNIS